MSISLRHCSSCGSRVKICTPAGDNRERHVCKACGLIHYQNPKIVCGCIPVWRGRILLCRRAIEPRLGLWTLPAGFMENGESVQNAAARETQEEACAAVSEQKLFGVYNLIRANQIYVMFLANLQGEDAFGVGAESLEVALFSEAEIPWDELAFPVIRRTLEHYLAITKNGNFSVWVEDIV